MVLLVNVPIVKVVLPPGLHAGGRVLIHTVDHEVVRVGQVTKALLARMAGRRVAYFRARIAGPELELDDEAPSQEW